MAGDFNRKLGLRIRELRITRKLRQCELADILEMERSNLTRIENGTQMPNTKNLEKIARALNVDIKELYDFSHKNKTREELISSITEILHNLTNKELEFCYKNLNNLLQLRQ